ncbi:MAG: GYF domain-containing protein [Verrucomicrobiae bacterium]|nr:GYF domain-containing protein [Verrucomicrobiae bacterium]
MPDTLYYYSPDGSTTRGPVLFNEIRSLLEKNEITGDCWVYKNGENEWKPAKERMAAIKLPIQREHAIPESPIAQPTHVNQASLKGAAAESETSSPKREPSVEGGERRLTKKRMLKAIRADYTKLWEAQLEAIVCRISDEKLPCEYRYTQKQRLEFYQQIEKNCLSYWRETGLLEKWIDDIIWKGDGVEADLTRKLKGADVYGKTEDAMKWLDLAGWSEEAGCYCFIKSKEYIYIGQAINLAQRLKERNHFGAATHLRVIIPGDKRWLNRLERMLILNYEPTQNDRQGISGNNPADEILDYILGEIEELQTDIR